MRYFHRKDGQDITGYFSFENEFVRSYKGYLTGQPGDVYIQVLEDTRLITFTRRDMEHFGRLLAEYYLICYEDRVTAFITQTPEERYLQLYIPAGKYYSVCHSITSQTSWA